MLRFILCVLLLAYSLAAQITVENHSGFAYSGWLRSTYETEKLAGKKSGVCPVTGYRWVVGRKIGVDLSVVDVEVVDLTPGDKKTVTLGEESSVNLTFRLPVSSFPVVQGKPMLLHKVARDGSALTAEFRVRVGDFIYLLYARQHTNEPYIRSEMFVVNSNRNTTRLVSELPALNLVWEDCWVQSHGFPQNRNIADGQGRVILSNFLKIQPSTRRQMISSISRFEGKVFAWSEVPRFYGQSTRPNNSAFINNTAKRSWDALGDWSPPPEAPMPMSGATGRQGDQFLQQGSEYYPLINYWSNLRLHASRPSNHCEPNGDPFNKDLHPNCWLWDGRPHFGLGSDRLGKTSGLGAWQAHNYYGPDAQHWLIQGLVAAYRETASPLAQRLLEQHGSLLLGSLTTTPGWSTSVVFSAREIGYRGFNVVHLWRNLENRQAAGKIKSLFLEWGDNILKPRMNSRSHFFTFTDDNRLGDGDWAIAWQESLGAWGCYVAGLEFGDQELLDISLKVSKKMLADAWVNKDGQWLSRADYPLDNPAGKPANGDFNDFGMPMCVYIVNQLEPGNTKANAIKLYLDQWAYAWWPGGN